LTKHISKTEHNAEIFSPLYINNYINNLPKELVNGRFVDAKYIDRIPKKSRIIGGMNRAISKRQIDLFNPDIVHETFYSKHKTYKKSKCTVITVYDMIHELFNYYQPPYHRGWAEKNISINRADHIICISENTKKDLIELLGVDEKKISVTYLGFEKSKPLESVNQSYDIHRPYLLYVGWREWYKNFAGFLESIASSNRLIGDFNIVAFGGGAFTVEQLALISRLGFDANQVKQIEGNDDLLAHYYSNATAFVNPSLYEGFGLAPLEAMSYNCPVVSSNTSSMPEVIGDAAEYFNPKSVESMRISIERVVYSKSRSDELIQAGKERCTLFSWQKCANETLDVYQKIL
jgi:glycosyltransferase involved in cell wall biosynthesis